MAHSDEFPDFDIVELPEKSIDVNDKVSKDDEVTYEGDEVKAIDNNKDVEVKKAIDNNKVDNIVKSRVVVPKNLVNLDTQMDLCIKYICGRIQKCEPSNWYKNHANFSITLEEKLNYCTDRIDYYIRTYKPYYNVQFRYKMYFNEIIVSMADFIRERYNLDVNVIIVECLKFKAAALAKDKSEEDIDVGDELTISQFLDKYPIILGSMILLLMLCIYRKMFEN